MFIQKTKKQLFKTRILYIIPSLEHSSLKFKRLLMDCLRISSWFEAFTDSVNQQLWSVPPINQSDPHSCMLGINCKDYHLDRGVRFSVCESVLRVHEEKVSRRKI